MFLNIIIFLEHSKFGLTSLLLIICHNSNECLIDSLSQTAMDVVSILRNTETGRKVEAFVREHKYIDISHQISLMRLLYDYMSHSRESPLKQ